ncbi:Uncharacterised protein [Bordetella pertussis]|nr:Uncharacterised protein [Bordetella pertussis]
MVSASCGTLTSRTPLPACRHATLGTMARPSPLSTRLRMVCTWIASCAM